MIYELYIIELKSGIPFIDKTYRKVHFGTHNTLISGLLHVIYQLFNAEMEIGNVKSVATKEYKLIYLVYKDLLIVALADIILNESQVQRMIESIATTFYGEFETTLTNWTNNVVLFRPFIPKMDSIVIGTISDLFFEEYPTNIVGLVDYLDKNYTLEYQELIGKSLAEKILTERYNQVANQRNLKKELSKFTVIKRLTDHFIELSVCPFCRKKDSPVPICNFVGGFIKGLLQSDAWVEKTCVSCGDSSCTFSNEG
ncbi:MAG TPA: hypothetical protein VMV49_16355 [Candidatus Deferrimicrobium sp.]|nr:hypothetical protein [Candidatus Deferrimicrobium sp.]